MKHGTKAVKDKSAPDSHEDEPDHMLRNWLEQREFKGRLKPEVRAEVRRVCQDAFTRHRPASHANWKQLEKEVIKIFGSWLHLDKNRTKLKCAVINLLIKANANIKDETDIGEM